MIFRPSLLSAVFLAAGVAFGGALTKEEIAASTRAYFAPMSCLSSWRMRMPDGVIREFSPEGRRSEAELVSVDGWTAHQRGEDIMMVTTPADVSPKLEWGFQNGTLRMLAVDGQPYGLEYPEPVVYDGERIVSLWPEASELTREDFEIRTNWDRGRRFRLWFGSPNRAGTFVAYFALVALALAFRLRRRPGRLVSFAASAVLLGVTCLTDSRGALVAFAIGAALIGFAAWRRAGGSFRRLCVGALAVLAVLVAATVWMRVTSPRSVSSYGRSDSTRHEILRAAPQMFASSPAGWGRYGLVGSAYFDWYEDSQVINPRLNLISDHLTHIIGGGWLGGGLYVFCWAGGLLFLLLLALRGASPLPVALWVALGVSATFNLIFSDWELWAPPIASLALILPARPWRAGRLAFWSAAGGLVAGLVVVGGLLLAASLMETPVPSVRREGGRYFIGGENPRIWVVDDQQSLGHVMTGKEIRRHYHYRPNAEPIGYVRRLDDLPEGGRVEALVLAGVRGREFLRRFEERGGDVRLPQAVVFLSPPFGPSEIPETLRSRTSVSVLIGEFAARYYRGYEKPLPWVTVVPGAEQYIPGWMRYLVR